MRLDFTRRNDFWPLVIVVIAAFLRFNYLGEIQHNVDQAYPVWQALRTLEHGEWPVVGQGTSVLFANPALTGYLYLPFVALTRSALGAYLLVITLNTLAVLLAYRAVKGLLGTMPALVAAALMAVNPWVIEYSRATWVQSLLPFFVCAIAWLLWPVLLGRSRNPKRRTLLALVMLTLVSQTYLLAYFLILPVGLLILIFWRRLPKRALLIGSGIFVAASLVYGAGLLADTGAIQQNLDKFSSGTPHLTDAAWNHATRLISGADYPLARGQNTPINDWQHRQTLTQIAHDGLLALLLTGILLAAISTIRRGKKRDEAIILLVWFGLPVLLMSYVSQPVHPFYQLLGLPAGYALVGWTLASIPSFRFRNAIIVGLLIPFGLLMAVNSQRFAQETAAIPGAHDLGALPLNYGLQLGHTIVETMPAGGTVYAEVDEWTLNSLAGTTFPLVRDTRSPDFTIVPHSGGAYVVGHITAPEQWIPPAFTTVHHAIPLPGNSLLTVDGYAADAAQQIAPETTLNIASEEGLTLLGYDVDRSQCEQTLPHPPTPSPNWRGADEQSEAGVRSSCIDDPITLTLYWRVDSVTAATTGWYFAPFAQAFDTSGSQMAVIEGAMVPGTEWRIGDVHVHRLQLPPGTTEVKIGQFDGPRQHNMIFLPDYTPLIAVSLGA